MSTQRDSTTDKRQKNQYHLAFPEESRGAAPRASVGGTESGLAKRTAESPATEQWVEEVCERENCKQALRRVKANKGSPGIDGMTVEELSGHLKEHWPAIREQLLSGTYRPQPVRRVEIPKPDGGCASWASRRCWIGLSRRPSLACVIEHRTQRTGPRTGAARTSVHALCGRLQHLRSQSASRERVMRSVTRLLTTKLQLRVNSEKSAVARPWERKFLGFASRIISNRRGAWRQKRWHGSGSEYGN
jgi:RNA-directed DNA polymerase